MSHRRLQGLLVACAIVVTTLPLIAGCSTESCLPAALAANPTAVAPGGSVRLSAPAADCEIDLSKHGHYTFDLLTGSTSATSLGTVEVASDGHFSADLTIPTNAPTGRASIVVHGSAYDDCPPGASCVGYSITITIRKR